MTEDNYDEALEKLYSVALLLYGGYYEPKSDRDKALADELNAIWCKHCLDEEGAYAGVFNPKNHHLFSVEAGLKAFAHIKV